MYVTNLESEMEDGYEAIGSPQIANSVLVIPVNHYAFGTLLMSHDFKKILGLTQYGKTVTNLTITNVVKGIDADIDDQAFVLYAKFKFPIDIIADTTFDLYYAKGSFTSLTLGSGIKK
ncbi:MAG: hypothetical protein MJ223_03915 [Mycoplasmoidaceae bacterium]|nr:hypothetical protein [Mycoplasmoidaceae bacterium]